MARYKNDDLIIDPRELMDLAKAAQAIQRKFRSAKWEVCNDGQTDNDVVCQLCTNISGIRDPEDLNNILRDCGFTISPYYYGYSFEFGSSVEGAFEGNCDDGYTIYISIVAQ